jgi:hypothetical protein
MISSGSECQRSIVQAAKAASKEALAVIADKDGKRRVFMSKEGYSYRLYKGFLADPEYYRMCRTMSLEEVANIRNYLADCHLPLHISRKHAFSTDNIQYAYHTYKTKCLSLCSGLTCTRDHAHEREIISDVRNPYRSYFRLIARSIRLVKFLACEPCWTLWYLNQLKIAVTHATSCLLDSPEHQHQCVCGKPKEAISLAKVDASQYFKNADITRGIDRICLLLDRVQNKTGFNAVAILHGQKMQGHLCKTNKRSDNAFRIVTFSDMKSRFGNLLAFLSSCCSRHKLFLFTARRFFIQVGAWGDSGSWNPAAFHCFGPL